MHSMAKVGQQLKILAASGSLREWKLITRRLLVALNLPVTWQVQRTWSFTERFWEAFMTCVCMQELDMQILKLVRALKISERH